MAAGKIFVCYRREDSAGHAGRLYDRLNQRFPGRVFMDVAGIGVGTRWAEVIEQTLGSCEVAVILIGRRWLERDSAGARRIDDTEDSLRAEIATVLRLKLKVVPLLVAGAAVPEPHDLPADVAPVVAWQALRIDDDDFDHDSSRLITALELQLKDEDKGTDLHLESAEMKRPEIHRLMAHAESCIAGGDWVTAAQTLQAVLSLDKANAEAANRLRFVQEQSARTYNHPVMPPAPSKARPGRWAAFGILGLLGGIGAAVAAVVLIALIVLAYRGSHDLDGQRSLDGSTNAGTPPRAANDANPAVDGQTTTPQEPAAPPMAGDYDLTSYTLQGMMIPLNGGMRLVSLGGGRFQFGTTVTNRLSGAVFNYNGFLEDHGSHWATTTLQTNDPSAIAGAIPTQVRFDGSMLIIQNSYGQSSVWRKH